MAERHNMSFKFDITTDAGEKFMDASVNYYGLKYEQMVAIEEVIGKATGSLVEIAKAEAEVRQGKYSANENGLIKSR